MAISRNKPLDIFKPWLKEGGSLTRFPKTIPRTKANRIALNCENSAIRKATAVKAIDKPIP